MQRGAREASELRTALEGEKRRRARQHKKVQALQHESEQALQSKAAETADQFARLQEHQMRVSQNDKELAAERARNEAATAKLLQLRGSLVEQAFSKLSFNLLKRCWTAWAQCAAQHKAFKALQRDRVVAVGVT